MSDSAVVTFRLLSGNNIGAVFTLPQGKYTLGNSDSCDIQLDESGEPTVVGLVIAPNLAVSVVLLNGKARLDGEELERGQALPFASAKVLAIGFSALTHLDEGEDPFTVDLSMLGLASKQEPTAAANNTDNASETTPAEDSADAADAAAANTAPASNVVTTPSESVPTAGAEQQGALVDSAADAATAAAGEGDAAEAQTRPRWHISKLVLLIVGLILLGLALSSLIAGSSLFGARAKQREALQTATDYISAQGFKHVTADFDDRVITFKGHVESQEEFNRLVNNLPPLPYATVLALDIKDSLLLRVEQACAVRGASVSAAYLPQLRGVGGVSERRAIAANAANAAADADAAAAAASADGSAGESGESGEISASSAGGETGETGGESADGSSASEVGASGASSLHDFTTNGLNQAKIAIRGYVQDQLVEAALLRSVSADLQCDNLVGAFTLKPQLEAIIARFLPMELYNVPLLPDRFKVYYDGELTLTQMQLLAALQERVSQEVRAEVMFEPLSNRDRSMIEQVAQNFDKLKRMPWSTAVSTSTTTPPKTEGAQEKDAKDSVAEQAQSEPLDFDEISGVTMTPLRFVSMKDGSKYFEGSVMSNGAVLKSISVHALTFEVNGELVIHELK